MLGTTIVNVAKQHGDTLTNNSVINFITKNYATALELKKMPCVKLKGVIARENHIQVLADWYMNDLLEERLAGMITEFYVKENLKEQSMFATDVVRYNYLVKEKTS